MSEIFYTPNLPEDVQAKIKLLAEYQSQIANLESQLQDTRLKYDRLQNQLLQERVNARPVSLDSITTPIGINKLPDEILLDIFEYYLSEIHRRIRTIITVCKRWHSITVESPRLWARIQVPTMSYISYPQCIDSSLVYIEACVQRSKPLLLDIEIYHALATRDECIRDVVANAVGQFADKSECDAVSEWAAGLECYFDSLESAKYDAYSREVIHLLGSLVGPAGIHMERWQSLDLCFPYYGDDAALQIWGCFIGPAPNLKSAHLTNVECVIDYMLDGVDEALYDRGFPVLSGLRSLTLDTPYANSLFDIYLLPSNLHHLAIHYYHDLEGMERLSSKFPLLRKLSLTTSLGTGAELGHSYHGKKNPLFVMRLPHLRQLTLVGNSQILRHVEFDFPSLEELQICTPAEFYLPASFSSARIRWSLPAPSHVYWTPSILESSLAALLQSSSRIETVTIQEQVKVYVPKVLSELRRSSSVPASLERIVVELDDGRREFIDVSNS